MGDAVPVYLRNSLLEMGYVVSPVAILYRQMDVDAAVYNHVTGRWVEVVAVLLRRCFPCL